jgi:hypothetical protein
MARRTFALLVANAALFTSALASAWALDVTIGPSSHGHRFERVVLEASDCQLKVRLFFQAPVERYKSEWPQQNYYRFKARLKFAGAEPALTRIFHNTAPGARVYDATLDTTEQGCWAKTAHELRGVDIESCRARGCTPEPFK